MNLWFPGNNAANQPRILTEHAVSFASEGEMTITFKPLDASATVANSWAPSQENVLFPQQTVVLEPLSPKRCTRLNLFPAATGHLVLAEPHERGVVGKQFLASSAKNPSAHAIEKVPSGIDGTESPPSWIVDRKTAPTFSSIERVISNSELLRTTLTNIFGGFDEQRVRVVGVDLSDPVVVELTTKYSIPGAKPDDMVGSVTGRDVQEAYERLAARAEQIGTDIEDIEAKMLELERGSQRHCLMVELLRMSRSNLQSQQELQTQILSFARGAGLQVNALPLPPGMTDVVPKACQQDVLLLLDQSALASVEDNSERLVAFTNALVHELVVHVREELRASLEYDWDTRYPRRVIQHFKALGFNPNHCETSEERNFLHKLTGGYFVAPEDYPAGSEIANLYREIGESVDRLR